MRTDTALGERVTFVSLATLTLSEQLRLVGSASGLAGVHGAALALLVFLPSHACPCALLELKMRSMLRKVTHALTDYQRLAAMSNVRRFELPSYQPDTPECANRYFRSCGNLTVDVEATVAVLRMMLTHGDGPCTANSP